MKRSAVLAGILALVAACGTPAAPDPFDGLSSAELRALPPVDPVLSGRPGPLGTIVIDPVSSPIEHGVAYRFALGHCGLSSPVDVDGSFWDPTAGWNADGAPLDLAADTEMINATPGAIVVVADEMRYRSEAGSVVHFARHSGEKGFPGCD